MNAVLLIFFYLLEPSNFTTISVFRIAEISSRPPKLLEKVASRQGLRDLCKKARAWGHRKISSCEYSTINMFKLHFGRFCPIWEICLNLGSP